MSRLEQLQKNLNKTYSTISRKVNLPGMALFLTAAGLLISGTVIQFGWGLGLMMAGLAVFYVYMDITNRV
jgi:hypothetical protein